MNHNPIRSSAPVADECNYKDLYVFVPEFQQLLYIQEGSGDNLTKEDIANHYVDYIDYTVYDLDNGIVESDGGQVLLIQLFREQYQQSADCIPDVLDMQYDKPDADYIVLNT